MKKLAYTDPVTHLENRHSLMAYLDEIIESHKAHQKKFSLLFLDLDDFKLINDRYGHALGDSLLIEVANRLSQGVRSRDVVGRFGGDEFVIVLEEGNETEVDRVTRRIIASMAEVFHLDGKLLHVTASMGVSNFPDHGDTPSQLISNADIALYKAKSLGKNCTAVFNRHMQERLHSKMQDENDLREAINNDQIYLEYQPIVNAQTHEIVQFEALARWKRDGEYVDPSYFIGIAEERNLIVPLGDKLISKIFADLVMLNTQNLPDFQVSFNLSPFQFADFEVVNKFKSLLESNQIKPKQLEIEITENSLFKDIDLSIKQLEELKEIGLSISIDDFGTGYSSLSHLKKLPIDKIKIDRSFVAQIPHNSDDTAINQAIIAMSKKLHLKVVAEGIETREQSGFFTDNQCDFLQGFYFSRPVVVSKIKSMMMNRKSRALG